MATIAETDERYAPIKLAIIQLLSGVKKRGSWVTRRDVEVLLKKWGYPPRIVGAAISELLVTDKDAGIFAELVAGPGQTIKRSQSDLLPSSGFTVKSAYAGLKSKHIKMFDANLFFGD